MSDLNQNMIELEEVGPILKEDEQQQQQQQQQQQPLQQQQQPVQEQAQQVKQGVPWYKSAWEKTKVLASGVKKIPALVNQIIPKDVVTPNTAEIKKAYKEVHSGSDIGRKKRAEREKNVPERKLRSDACRYATEAVDNYQSINFKDEYSLEKVFRLVLSWDMKDFKMDSDDSLASDNLNVIAQKIKLAGDLDRAIDAYNDMLIKNKDKVKYRMDPGLLRELRARSAFIKAYSAQVSPRIALMRSKYYTVTTAKDFKGWSDDKFRREQKKARDAGNNELADFYAALMLKKKMAKSKNTLAKKTDPEAWLKLYRIEHDVPPFDENLESYNDLRKYVKQEGEERKKRKAKEKAEKRKARTEQDKEILKSIVTEKKQNTGDNVADRYKDLGLQSKRKKATRKAFSEEVKEPVQEVKEPVQEEVKEPVQEEKVEEKEQVVNTESIQKEEKQDENDPELDKDLEQLGDQIKQEDHIQKQIEQGIAPTIEELRDKYEKRALEEEMEDGTKEYNFAPLDGIESDYEPQDRAYDCYSVAGMKLINHFLKENNMQGHFTQQQLREYVPKFKSFEESGYTDHATYEEDKKAILEFLNGNKVTKPGNLYAMADFFLDNAPGAMMRKMVFSPSSINDDQDVDGQIYKNVLAKFNKSIYEGLKRSGAVGIMSNGHYQTIVGMNGSKLQLLDSTQSKKNPVNYNKTIHEVESYSMFIGLSVELVWLEKEDVEDLKKNFKGLKEKPEGGFEVPKDQPLEESVAQKKGIAISKDNDEKDAGIAEYYQESAYFKNPKYVDNEEQK